VSGAVTDPWADPSTPTEPGAPYTGPPPTAPVPGGSYGQYPPPYGYPGPHGYPAPYGQPHGAPWGPPPQKPRRPGQVITSAVLAFVQAGVVLIASLYVWFFASLADVAAAEAGAANTSRTMQALATEGTVLAVVQLVSAVLLVVAGIAALNRRTGLAWLLLLGAHAVQVVLAVYWTVRMLVVLGDVPGPGAEESFVAFTLFFAAAPLVGLGLVVGGPGRRWFAGGSQA
jgi:hypothetical protein